MVRKYKAKGNFEKLWQHVDNALSELNLMQELKMDMDFSEDEYKELQKKLESFDESELVAIKNDLEEIIEGYERKEQ